MANAAPRRFEMTQGGHSKFWEIGVRGRAITVRFGRIGSKGAEKTTTFATPREANEAAARLVYEKTTRKGYAEIKHAPPKAIVVKRVASAADKGQSFARLSALWAVKRTDLEKGLRRGATTAQLASFETKLGLPLPSTFRALYAWHDGATDEDGWFEGAYGFCRLVHILSHKQMLDDVRGDDGTWNKAWVPFLQNNSSDFVCLDTTTGEIFEWFNYGGTNRVVLAPTFDAWLAAHVAITEAAKSLDDDDKVYDAFVGPKANKVRAKLSPGYPKGRRG